MMKPIDQPLANSNGASNSDLRGNVTTFAQKYLQSRGSVGLAIGVITEGESQSFFYGSQAADGSGLLDERSIFEIGSITKVFTTLVLADMHLRKEVALDDPVNHYVPSAAKVASRDGAQVTLRHLATHTSGLPRLPRNLDLQQADIANPYAHYTVEDLYAGLAETKLASKPGTRSVYSNLGSGLLGHVLAQVAGTDYETLVKRRICEPLGMLDTGITLSVDQQQRLVPGHSGGKRVSNWDLPALAGAGALRSSLADMLRFLQANIEPSATALAPAIVLAHEIQTRQVYRLYRDFGCMAPLIVAGLSGLFTWQSFHLPMWARVATVVAIPAVLFYFWPRGLNTMTLGWHVDDLLCSKPVLWHNGGTGGYASYMAFVQETKRGVILLANSDVELDAAGQQLLQLLEKRAATA